MIMYIFNCLIFGIPIPLADVIKNCSKVINKFFFVRKGEVLVKKIIEHKPSLV